MGLRKGDKHRPETIERLRRVNRRTIALRKARTRVQPKHLRMLQSGDVPEPFKPLLEAARHEHMLLRDAIGGDDASPQRLALVEDATTLGMIARALTVRLMQSGDLDLSSKLASVMSARRAALMAAGLNVHRRELELADYVRQLEERKAQAEADGEPSPRVKPPKGLRRQILDDALEVEIVEE